MTNNRTELFTIADAIEQNGGWHIAALKVREAADEIERLRAALQWISEWKCGIPTNCDLMAEVNQKAREALQVIHE